jgi:hypothetical protein
MFNALLRGWKLLLLVRYMFNALLRGWELLLLVRYMFNALLRGWEFLDSEEEPCSMELVA